MESSETLGEITVRDTQKELQWTSQTLFLRQNTDIKKEVQGPDSALFLNYLMGANKFTGENNVRISGCHAVHTYTKSIPLNSVWMIAESLKHIVRLVDVAWEHIHCPETKSLKNQGKYVNFHHI